MRPASSRLTAGLSGLPRARGDAPGERSRQDGGHLAPPRPRGCACGAARAGEDHDGSPAPAGMRRKGSRAVSPRRRLPRARGDAPYGVTGATKIMPAPPRPRGCAGGPSPGSRHRAGSPAPAGMRPVSVGRSPGSARLPRARGDAPSARLTCSRGTAAPPRPRGCAGMTRMYHVVGVGLPRARGDAPVFRREGLLELLAPPRPRGCAVDQSRGAVVMVGSPAPAGMRPPAPPPSARCCGLPRARGDAPRSAMRCAVAGSAPPRPRGCARRSARDDAIRWGSPAPAGMRLPP